MAAGLGGLCLFGLVAFAFHNAWMIGLFLRSRTHLKAIGRTSACHPAGLCEFPSILVQLPIFNEIHVAERVIHAALRLNWPCNKIRIQILDDSNDATSSLIDRY